MRLSNRAALSCLCTLLLVSCESAKRKNSPIPVRIALTNVPLSYLPVILANQLGFYRQEGLVVTIDDLPTASKVMEALVAGSADVAAGNYEQVIQMATEGRHVKAFALMLGQSSRVLVVMPGRARTLRRIEDLKGSVVGVAGLGSVNHLFLNYVLLKHGVAPEQVTTVAIGTGASAIAAIEHGRVEAAVLVGTETEIAKKRIPAMVVLLDSRGVSGSRSLYGSDMYPSTVLSTTGAWLQENPSTATHLGSAIRSALQWASTHSAEQILAVLPDRYRMADRDAELQAFRVLMPSFSHDGIMPAEGAQVVRTALAFSMEKVRKSTFKLSETYTNEFVATQSAH